jgi:hypothetical protein
MTASVRRSPHKEKLNMIGKRHYKRLEQMYASEADRGGAPAVAFGRAELKGSIEESASGTVVTQSTHHALLSDAASLAAGSLEKERQVAAEQFQAQVSDEEYRGPVQASARVVAAQPPRYIVEAVLRTPDGHVVAEALGVFHPTSHALPAEPEVSIDDRSERSTAPQPASFIPLYETPFGMVCLN